MLEAPILTKGYKQISLKNCAQRPLGVSERSWQVREGEAVLKK